MNHSSKPVWLMSQDSFLLPAPEGIDDSGTHGLPELLEPMVIVDWTKFTKNRCLWTGINMVKFHRIEVLGPPLEPEFWDLSFGKGPRLPGSHPYSKYSKKPSKSRSKNTFLSRNGSGKVGFRKFLYQSTRLSLADSKTVVLAKNSQYFQGKSGFFCFLPEFSR